MCIDVLFSVQRSSNRSSENCILFSMNRRQFGALLCVRSNNLLRIWNGNLVLTIHIDGKKDINLFKAEKVPNALHSRDARVFYCFL